MFLFMRNFLIISAVFPPEPVVSAKLSNDIANSLSQLGHVTVLTPSPSRPFGFKFIYTNQSNEFNHVVLNSYVNPSSSVLGRMYESLSFGFQVRKYIVKNHEKIDVIYANTWPVFSQLVLVLTSNEYNIPVILHVQDIYPESISNKYPALKFIINKIFLPIDRYILQNSNHVIAISHNMKKRLHDTRKVEKNKISVVFNWQNENDFINLENHKLNNESQNNFIFMYLGNIGPVAGVELLIEAFHVARIPNSKLIIAGSGSCKSFLQNSCIDKNYENVVFKDVAEGLVPEIQDNADVLLLPIRKGAAISSIPSKLPAYMFSAKPIIACVDSESDTAITIVESKCGWVIEPDNAELLATKMIEMVNLTNMERKEMGGLGKEYSLLNFSKKENLKKIIDIITEF